MSSAPSPLADHQQLAHPWRRSGTWMVIIMFAFAFLMVGLMYMYWIFYTAPFRPLQLAIGNRHHNSMPRIIGGKYKSHQPENKAILRIIIAVDFDPTLGLPRPEGSPSSEEDRVTVIDEMVLDPRVEELYASLIHLAKLNSDLSKYEVIDIHLEHRRPEKSARWLFSTHPKDDWFQKYPTDPLAKPTEPVAASDAARTSEDAIH